MFDLADTRTILLLGEPGAGKSSLVHALCTDGPQISRDPRGETCRFAAFSSHLGCFIDSPGPPGSLLDQVRVLFNWPWIAQNATGLVFNSQVTQTKFSQQVSKSFNHPVSTHDADRCGKSSRFSDEAFLHSQPNTAVVHAQGRGR